MKETNILILSAGRRVELVTCFAQARQRLGVPGRIIAGDCSVTAPALYFADERRLLPRISEPGYVDAVIGVSRECKVSLIVPTIDTDLLLLAQNRGRIERECGAKVLVSDERVIAACRDKRRSARFFAENSFPAPRLLDSDTLSRGDFRFPLFVKPADGSSSVNAFRVDTKEELAFFLRYVPNPMVQEFVSGQEYTVDVFCDFCGKIIAITPRLRLATRGGESLKGKIDKDAAVTEQTRRLIERLRPVGHITVQCIKNADGVFFLEVNPRFGGGAPMSIAAGADSCAYLYRLLRGETLEFEDAARDGLLFTRFDRSICLDENMEPVR